MILIRFACLVLLLLPVLPAQQRVRVLSYNIHHGEGVDARIDLERIAKVITSVEPDLVALQEVDVRTTRVNGADQAAELARLTGMHVVFGRTIPYRGGLYGNALLSRWPLNGFVNHEFPFTPGREKRGVIEAIVWAWPSAGGEQAFHFLATHFDTTEPDRLSAAATLQRLIAERPEGWPMILAGDINATPGSRTLNALAPLWTAASTGEPLPTFPVNRPDRQIDFIFFRPAERWRTVEARVLDEAEASDHRPLFAVLELLPEPRIASTTIRIGTGRR